MIARLKPGVDQRQGDAELASIEKSFRIVYPERRGPQPGISTIQYQKWLLATCVRPVAPVRRVLFALLIACSTLLVCCSRAGRRDKGKSR